MSKKTFLAKVVSAKMQKTVVVTTQVLKKHVKYGKYLKVTKRFKAHIPEKMKLKEGQTVKIESSRPMSKDVTWIVKEVI